MSGILFLAHRLPFPPDRGDKIRSHHILGALAEIAPLHVGCFAESDNDFVHEGELGRIAASHFMPLRTKPLSLAGAEALLHGEPVSLAAFRHNGLMNWVRDVLRREEIDTIYVFSGQMGQYVPRDWDGQLVVDLVDVDSAKFDAYARAKPVPMRWVDAREGRLLRVEEERLAVMADHTLLVSEAEAELMRSRLTPGVTADIRALGNGIDADHFDPAVVPPQVDLAIAEGPQLVFTGQMDYAPNVSAALRVMDHVLPEIRRVHPQAQFHVVGRAPVHELRARDGKGGCRVWGEVPDVRPFLAAADLVIAPLQIARGVQNKVLEAMAMARPVLLTSDAATGIPASDGLHFAVEDEDAHLVFRALGLIADTETAAAMGSAARKFVVERMSWPAMLAALPDLVENRKIRDAA
ncbi:sugar transferase (PEP-CTERM/EpsH1 system associated) [Altererythrobacter atlanticus]|uniref:Glycosyl transferases group 1 n=1 Tax=Croceibacterium atlanticum TaxID=1267766 RepID=A0A0F7KRG9_9SPHN|nr:TIGR03087 family PEP-CTERM/XrtA system glycosyltransferase [Croceibacterium atlanticum]AKH41711.1 Glycosyl transferases group 1 [Croceibacterium atlanticum]MBB5733175.1 sugar transferase (PEP-CTERM/EpsH1 system associated) [Croceibacterium atlanticum]